jgi:hypothetical protein
MAALLSQSRYLVLWACLVGAGLCLAALVNLVVDPYGIYDFVVKRGLNEIKPHAEANGIMTKAYQVQRVKPRTLVLGNSRAEDGFNPESRSWPPELQPVYNLALPGTGPRTSLRYLEHATAVITPATVVLGVDFMDFLVRENAVPYRAEGKPLPIERRLLLTESGRPNPDYLRQRVEDFFATVLSLDALIHSINTVNAQYTRYPENLTEHGFNPMRDYEGIAKREGYYAMFRQRDLENARDYLLRRPKNIYAGGKTSSPQLEVFRRIIAVCQEQNAELKVVIYPYHAHLLEIFHEAGLWPVFEEWKRALARIAAEANRSRNVPRIQLWDFSGYNAISAEPVPDPADRTTATRWYWEAGHFKQELGDVMLQRMFSETDRLADAVIGVKLTPENVEKEIQRIRQQRAWYRATYGREALMIRELVDMTQRGR